MANEKRLIDANILKVAFENAMRSCRSTFSLRFWSIAIDAVNSMPTVDAVEVVYCKKCKFLHCHSAVDRMFFCNNPKGLKGMPNIVEENPFCPYGERREGE